MIHANWRHLAALALTALASPVLAADNFPAKDGNGFIITRRAFDIGGGVYVDANILLDGLNNRVNPATSDLQATMNTALGALFKPGSLIGNTAFAITGPLPAFAAPPTVNLGTLNGAALDATLVTLNAKIDTLNTKLDQLHADNSAAPPPSLPPLSAGTAAIGSITNPAFGITGTATTAAPTYANGAAATASFDTTGALRTTGSSSGSAPTGTAGSPNPAVTTVQGISGGTPQPTVLTTGSATIGTVNLGTLNGVATAANQTALTTALGTPMQQTGGSVSQVVNGAAVSAANPLPVDTVVRATATDRGAVIGFAGAAITTTNGSNTITLTTPPAAGAFILGQQLAAAGVPAGATLATLASGALNAAGSTYTLSAAATITGSAVAATSIGPQQIMPANAARRGIQYQSQSAANFWANGTGAATADFHSLKIPANNYFETPPTHTGTGAVSVITDTPGAGLFVREY